MSFWLDPFDQNVSLHGLLVVISVKGTLKWLVEESSFNTLLKTKWVIAACLLQYNVDCSKYCARELRMDGVKTKLTSQYVN